LRFPPNIFSSSRRIALRLEARLFLANALVRFWSRRSALFMPIARVAGNSAFFFLVMTSDDQ